MTHVKQDMTAHICDPTVSVMRWEVEMGESLEARRPGGHRGEHQETLPHTRWRVTASMQCCSPVSTCMPWDTCTPHTHICVCLYSHTHTHTHFYHFLCAVPALNNHQRNPLLRTLETSSRKKIDSKVKGFEWKLYEQDGQEPLQPLAVKSGQFAKYIHDQHT